MSSTSTARKVLVTGAGAGIGEAVARAFATDGAHVTVADVDAEAAHRVAHEIGGTAWVVDLSNSEALADLRLDCDVLVNNAGVQYVSPVEDFPPEKFHLILNLMLEAPFLLIRAALPHMYANGFGRIINISSVHGLVASPFKSAYVAAKHGLEGLSKTVALEAGGRGVTSVCISPGYVRTALVDHQVADQAPIFGHGQVRGEALFVAVDREKVGALPIGVERRSPAPGLVPHRRPLHFDDIGAQVTEHH